MELQKEAENTKQTITSTSSQIYSPDSKHASFLYYPSPLTLYAFEHYRNQL